MFHIYLFFKSSTGPME
uniref:Uncharacterized protein n=1 Tax=Rhizophora mucronata TaxID=61149 RepID=A0A2P2QF13_RHIMU